MREIVLFVEDQAHYELLNALIDRLSQGHGVPVRLGWRNVVRGHGAVLHELKQFLRDLRRGDAGSPDLVLVATDANCTRLNDRLRELHEVTEGIAAPVAFAVPDPHVERWLLLDSGAFKTVFGRGCDAPDQKCERDRYKHQLLDSIRAAGIVPSLGGIEFAADIVKAMDLDQVARNDESFGRLVADLRSVFRGWQA